MTTVGRGSTKLNAAARPWIEIGAALDARLAASRKSSVAGILHDAAKHHGLAPRTLQTICKAYRFVNSNAKSVGVDVADVRAAAMSIDVLMRVERKSPSTALRIRRSVFLGEYSYRELRQIEKDVDSKRIVPVFEQVDWNAFAQEFVGEYFAGGELSLRFGPERQPYSHVANLLGVDLELSHNVKTACLFITPRILFSAHRGHALEHQIPKVLAAVGFYDSVMYLLWDDDEVGKVDDLLRKSNSGIFDTITTLHRFDVAAYNCFGDDVLGSEGQ